VSLYKKLTLLFIVFVMVVLGSTLGIVYTQSQALIEGQAEQKTVLLIQTINSALEAGIPDYEFEAILLHLSQQNHAIQSFTIYKLNGYFYDIASTNPNEIGKRAPVTQQRLMQQGVTVTTMHGAILHIISPVLINGVTLYSSDVEYSMVNDLSTTGVLLERFLIVGLVAVVLAALFLWAFSRRLLSRPLHAITGAANDIAAGNLQIDLVGLDRRSDEIGMLARSFVRMADQLKGILSGIMQTSEELSKAFQTLVAGGDSTARGALHVSDVMDHMGRDILLQVSETDKVAQLAEDLNAKVEVFSSLLYPPGNDDGEGEDDRRREIEELGLHMGELTDSLRRMRENAHELQSGLKTVVSTANGQLGWIQEANRSIARLKELSTELQKLTSMFDML